MLQEVIDNLGKEAETIVHKVLGCNQPEDEVAPVSWNDIVNRKWLIRQRGFFPSEIYNYWGSRKNSYDAFLSVEYIASTEKPLNSIDVQYIDLDKTSLEQNDEVIGALSRARELLDWEDNWDGEGAKQFKEETFKRAENFLRECSNYIFQTFSSRLKAPIVGPTHESALQLLWKLPEFKLLITIPEKSDEPISYFGKDEANAKLFIEGTYIEGGHGKGLFTWIHEEMKNA
jgi:hypothetical protein